MTAKTRTILLTVAITLLAVLVVQNFRATTIRFVVWEISIPLAVLVLLALGTGWGICRWWRR